LSRSIFAFMETTFPQQTEFRTLPASVAKTFGLILAALIALALIPVQGAAEDRHPLEPLDTSSPGATIYGFLEAVDDALRFGKVGTWAKPSLRHYLHQRSLVNEAMRALDLQEIAPVSRQQVGVAAGAYLYETLNRIELPPKQSIPDIAAFDEEGPASYTIPHTEISLTRIVNGPRAGEFLFSAETVSRAKEFFNRTKTLPYVRAVPLQNLVGFLANKPGWLIPMGVINSLPVWMKVTVLDHGLWKWIGLIILLALVAGVLLLIHHLVRFRGSGQSASKYLRRLVLPVTLMILLYLLVRTANVHLLNFSGAAAESIGLCASAVTFLAAAWVAWLLPMFIAELIIASPAIPDEGLNAHLLRLVARIVGIALAIVVIFYGARFMGIPLVGLLAGVSIGGLTIALATQDTLKNLLGSLMIYMDKPYEVGQRINIKGHDGVVEQIGLRSTKIRLLNGPVTSIPNEKMASEDIVNISRRPYIQRIFNVRIANDTPPKKIGRALEILRDILSVPKASETPQGDNAGVAAKEVSAEGNPSSASHPNEAINQPDFPPRVYFNDLAQDYLNFLIIYWYHPPAYWDYLEHATWVNTQIVERLDAEGIKFAMPSQKLHLAGDTHPLPIIDQRQGATAGGLFRGVGHKAVGPS
jgi:MscS family membrane protein